MLTTILTRAVLVLACFTTAFTIGTFTSGIAHAAAAPRPVWNGQHPARWTGLDAMCPASALHLHRWARTGPGAPWFRVECLPDGPGLWAWNAIIPKDR